MLKTIRRRDRRALISAVCLALPAAAGFARADENGTWASAVSGNWSASTNWTGGLVAGGATGQTADFSQTGTNAPLTVNLDASESIGTMLFNASTVGGVGGWTLSTTNGSVLTLAGPSGAVIDNESASKSVSVTIGVSLAGTLSSGSLELYAGTGSSTPSSIFLTGANTFTGEVDVEQGLIGINSASSLGNPGNDMFLDENTSTSGNAIEFLSQGINLSNPITLGRRTPINVDENNVTFSGAISGSTTGSFSVTGGNYVGSTSFGSLYLNPTSNTSKASWTIGGDTTLIAGNTVGTLGLDNALGTGTTNVGSGGTLAFKNTTGNPLTYSSTSITINNSGAAFDNAPVGAIENLAGTNTFGGTVSLVGGTGNQNGVGVTAGSLTLSGTITGGSANVFLKLGAGPLFLSGSNTFTGGTIVQAGTLVAGVSNSGSSYGAFGPTNGSTGSVSLGGVGSLSSGSLSVSVLTGGSFTVANPITATAGGTGNLSIGGNTDNNSVFSGAITLNNNLTVSQVANAGSNSLSITGGITGGTAGPETVTFIGPGNVAVTTFPIADNGANTLSVSSTAGTTTLAATNTYSGSTLVSGGTLNVTGSIVNSGTVTVSGTGDLVLAGANAVSSSIPITVSSSTAALTVSSSQTLASIASAGAASFTAGTSIVGLGSGAGTGTGTTGLTSGGITGSGNLTVNGTANLYASAIAQNLLTIGSFSTVTIADSSAPGNTAATSVLTDISNSGTLDLNNNDLIVLDTTQYSTVRNLIESAYDGGAWDNAGITSSSARANSGSYGVGYAQASTIGSTSFDGQSFTDAVLVKYTLLGDTQLRGTVGIGDYDTVLSDYGQPEDWSGGDFHYGGVVGIGDYDDVLSNYGAHANGNIAVGSSLTPAVTGSISPAATISPDLAKTDLKLEVNTTTGDVYVLATASAAFTGYTISDPSAHLLGGSNSPDPDKLLSVGSTSGGNTNVYETSGTYVDWFKITETASQVAEGQQQNGFGTHSSRDDTINIPAGGTIDFGEIYNTAASIQDLTFDFAEAGTEPTNGPTYYGAEVDYVTTPEPAALGVLGLSGIVMMRRRRK